MESILENFSWLLIFKIALLVAFLVYIGFSFIVVRQIQLMDRTIKLSFSGVIKTIVFFHFLLAIAVFFLSLFIL